ncbi:MAG TPA: glycosyltransferase [Longimicrobiaceae bacterium]|nr:glycosyltransferase [Longimicrobiaceae bacterium]
MTVQASAAAAAAPLHVLFFTASLGGGGAEKHLVRVANALDPARFRVSVAVARGGGAYERELEPHVRFHPLGVRRMTQALGPLRRLMSSARPDVVCSFLDHANCVAVAAARTLRDPPAVVLGVQAALSHSLHPRRGWKVRVIRRLIPRLYRRADAVVALSQGVRHDLLALEPRLDERIRVIYNAGYDEASLRAAAAPLPPEAPGGDGPLVVACGRLAEQKGFEFLVRAVARVRADHPVRLWIIGEGERRPGLEAEVERCGLAGAAWMPGFQPDPLRFMRAADVFVLSSLWEGFGNVLVEAMATGTAVIATDCPHGPSEILAEASQGLLVPPGDVDALEAALRRLLADPPLRRSMGAAGRERARHFAAPVVAAEYGALFERVSRGAATGGGVARARPRSAA